MSARAHHWDGEAPTWWDEETQTRRTAGRGAVLPREVVARCVDEYVTGASFAAIAGGLERDEVPTAHGGVRWWPATVRRVVTGRAAAHWAAYRYGVEVDEWNGEALLDALAPVVAAARVQREFVARRPGRRSRSRAARAQRDVERRRREGESLERLRVREAGRVAAGLPARMPSGSYDVPDMFESAAQVAVVDASGFARRAVGEPLPVGDPVYGELMGVVGLLRRGLGVRRAERDWVELRGLLVEAQRLAGAWVPGVGFADLRGEIAGHLGRVEVYLDRQERARPMMTDSPAESA